MSAAVPGWSRWMERACWAIALLCGAVYFGARSHGQHEHEAGLAAFSAALADSRTVPASSGDWQLATPPATSVETGSTAGRTSMLDIRIDRIVAPAPDTSLWSAPRIDHYQRSLSGQPATELPVAVMEIPRLALRVPVYADLSERNLNRGAGVVSVAGDTSAIQNLALAAHRDGWFRGLKDIEVGDRIELQDLSALRSYRVSAVTIVEPDDLSPLRPTEQPSLTLITCYPFYFVGNAPQRYIVRATANHPGWTSSDDQAIHGRHEITAAGGSRPSGLPLFQATGATHEHP